LIVLGLSDHIVSGAAVVRDGRVVAAVNEERLARNKMVMGFPRQSIRMVLDLAGVRPQELDHVAVGSRWGHFLNHYVDFNAGVLGVDEGPVKSAFLAAGARLAFLRSKIPLLEPLYYNLRQPIYAHRRRAIRAVLRKEFGITCPVEFVWHHRAHAAGAYYASGYDDALVVTLDGSGDGHSSHVYEVTGGRFELLHTVPSFDSLGNFYGYVTDLCGFKMGRHEGKVTGLAAYGKPSYRAVLDELIRYENGSMRNVGDVFRGSAVERLRRALPAPFDRADLSATIQTISEEICTRYVAHWAERTGRSRVALAGGVVANVKINQRIHEIPGVDSVFVFPAMSDEGLAAGAALAVGAERRPDSARRGRACFENAYLGPEFTEREIADALGQAGVPYGHSVEPESEIARLIARGYVVARFHGRMEYGPRALGNRSILYRPDDRSVNDWLNERLKRTEFMPFAPTTLAEDADRSYVGLRGAEESARYMTITFDCTPEMRRACAGVVHVDGTARPQLVAESDNPSYWRILTEFKRLTGLSTVVNTSFNIHEEPIVCSPQDAIRAFQDGHLDVLAIGPFLARNREADERVRRLARPPLGAGAELER
jgi:carbamoyltransferase